LPDLIAAYLLSSNVDAFPKNQLRSLYYRARGRDYQRQIGGGGGNLKAPLKAGRNKSKVRPSRVVSGTTEEDGDFADNPMKGERPSMFGNVFGSKKKKHVQELTSWNQVESY
jgi:hypothetical protein